MQAFYTCFMKFCLALNSYKSTKNGEKSQDIRFFSIKALFAQASSWIPDGLDGISNQCDSAMYKNCQLLLESEGVEFRLEEA